MGLPTPPAGPLLLVSFHCPPQGHMELNPGFSCGSLEIKAGGRRKTGAGYQGVREQSTAGSSVLRAADFPTYGTVPARPHPLWPCGHCGVGGGLSRAWTTVLLRLHRVGWVTGDHSSLELESGHNNDARTTGASWGRRPPSSGPTKSRLKDSGLELCRGARESLTQLCPHDGLG